VIIPHLPSSIIEDAFDAIIQSSILLIKLLVLTAPTSFIVQSSIIKHFVITLILKCTEDDDSSSHGVHITKMGNDDVHLHVQQQHGTGGHWCAKIIFFSLMAVLLGLVGLIIMENRGLEDCKSPNIYTLLVDLS